MHQLVTAVPKRRSSSAGPGYRCRSRGDLVAYVICAAQSADQTDRRKDVDRALLTTFRSGQRATEREKRTAAENHRASGDGGGGGGAPSRKRDHTLTRSLYDGGDGTDGQTDNDTRQRHRHCRLTVTDDRRTASVVVVVASSIHNIQMRIYRLRFGFC